MFSKKTIRDIDVRGKRILLRADYNVPIEKGMITDDYRIKQSLPTIQYLLEQDASLIICSHLGRPGGKPDKALSLEPVAKRLKALLHHDVAFVPDCVGPEVEKAAHELRPKQILLLENVRFHPEEESNDEGFARQLASLAEIFVQDGFGVVHHGAVSVSELPKYMPAVAGLLLEKEVDTITNVMQNPARPLMAVIAGAKIADKIDLLYKFIDIADFIAIGGAMANTFLAADGIEMGASKIDKTELTTAKEILAKAREKAKDGHTTFYLPQDGVVATSIDIHAKTRLVDWGTHVIADVEHYPKQPPAEASEIQKDEMVLDVGPVSSAFIAGAMQLAGTVIWNGTLGVTEVPGVHGPVGPFAHGTEMIIEAATGQLGKRPYSLVGGGDTSGYIEQRKLTDCFNHVSTGGGASLELMAGRNLPGVDALMNKDNW